MHGENVARLESDIGGGCSMQNCVTNANGGTFADNAGSAPNAVAGEVGVVEQGIALKAAGHAH